MILYKTVPTPSLASLLVLILKVHLFYVVEQDICTYIFISLYKVCNEFQLLRIRAFLFFYTPKQRFSQLNVVISCNEIQTFSCSIYQAWCAYLYFNFVVYILHHHCTFRYISSHLKNSQEVSINHVNALTDFPCCAHILCTQVRTFTPILTKDDTTGRIFYMVK